MQPKTTISIDGILLDPFKEVSLDQHIDEHHNFEITLDYEAVEDFGTHTLDKSREWLGKPVVINFNDKKEFVGVITNVQLTHNNGFHGKLLISGASTTTLLEAGAHTQSWLEKDLATIVNDVVDAAGIDAAVSPVYTSPIAYQCQYRETHFQFLKRLAQHYHEWLYYDGVQLIFGKPALEAAIPVAYGKEIRSLSIGIQAKASHRNIFSYNLLDDAQNESKTDGAVAGLNELGTFAFDVAKDLFKIEANDFSPPRVKDRSEIDTVLTNNQASAVANSNVLSATSIQQGLSIGSVIRVSSERHDNGALEIKNYGEYIIIQINHMATDTKEYVNQFRAIPAGVSVLPASEVTAPVAQPQIATVVSNEDPEQKGRVQVQFQWQSGEMKTSWLRVMTPDAGSSEHHTQNRGHVFIPEVDDQVMVGFRYNDPNRPFVMGSLFSGTTGAGGGQDNTVKSIITRSGHLLEFNDTDGAESITITDKNQNIIFIDTANKNIKIAAPETLDIEAKNINIRATENIYQQAKNMETQVEQDKIVGVGNAYETTAKKTYTLKTTDLSETVEGSKVVDVQSSLNIKASEATVEAGNGDITLKGAGVATLQGGGDVKVSKG